MMGEIALYRRLIRLARPYTLHFIGLLALGLLASPIALLMPIPLKIVVDSVLGTRPLPPLLEAIMPSTATRAGLLLLAVGLLVMVTLLGQLQGLASSLLRTYVGERLVLDFRARLVDQVHRLPLSYHDGRGTADSVYRIQQDAPAIQYIMVDGAVPFVTAAFTLVTMFVVTAHLDSQIGLVALAVSPPLFLLSRFYRPRLRRQSRQVKKLESSAVAIVQETLGALRVVKAFGQEAHETDRLLGRLKEGMWARLRLTLIGGRYGLLVGLVTSLAAASVLFIGVGHVSAGVLTLGQLLMVLSYLGQLYNPLKTMSRKTAGLQFYLASAERVFELLDERADVVERPDARPLKRATGAIEFSDVAFAYGSARPVLHDVSFVIQPGSRLGIVGASGAGKTTLISLLTRFYDPAQGAIRLDGVDVRDYQLQDLRRQFAVVAQDPVLFSTSIAENIAYARPGATREELVAAAQAANAHEFIVGLPHGYDTQVGERGVQLSGGQRQRIAIARAFLKDSPVLILDEPTSAVDAEAEKAILAGIRRLMRGRTVILITHRASLLEGCTALLVLEHGRVVSDPKRSLPLTLAQPPGAPATGGGARRSNLKNHPAVHAWCELYPHAEPLGITPLRVRRKKNQVYRLEGAGPDGLGVIAKRCPKAVALVERIISADLLPRLTVPSLRHYGYLEEPESEYSWVFMEEATGADYSNLLAEHRAHSARWLGLLHTSATAAAGQGPLRDAGPAHYLALLQAIRELMREHLDNPVLTPEDVMFIQGIRQRLDELEEHWNRLEDLCEDVPRTLVHGDFNGKNMRLRAVNGDSALVVFDWEHAGWGVPAVDLAQLIVPSGRLTADPDIPTYWSTVREQWPEVSLEACWRLADCGTVFRTLSALSWDAEHLAYDWAHAYVGGMQSYSAELDAALERLDWTHRPTRRRHREVAT
jgi:ATP-binding cassette, subfamily B, bacterial